MQKKNIYEIFQTNSFLILVLIAEKELHFPANKAAHEIEIKCVEKNPKEVSYRKKSSITFSYLKQINLSKECHLMQVK